jgi:hypothetical protein
VPFSVPFPFSHTLDVSESYGQLGQRAPKLRRRLRTAIKTVLEVLGQVLHVFSGSEYDSGKNQQNMVLVSLFMVLFGSFTLIAESCSSY